MNEPACRLLTARLVVFICLLTGAALGATDYGDYSSFGSASSTVNSKLKLGATIDSESSANTNSSATGDDDAGSDDEDSVTMPASMYAGTSTTLTIKVTNTRGSTAFLNAWIDYNQNGSLTDSGEQIANNTTIATGTSNANKSITFTVPTTATAGSVGVRIRLTSVSSPGPTGADGTGEVEDYVTTIVPCADHGDYSLFADASSTLNSKLRIGATTDYEATAAVDSTATGDDNNGSDDEDGVTMPTSLMLGSSGTMTVNVTNTSGSSAYLSAWIDYNRNGSLSDSGEQIASNTIISTGTSNANKTLSFTVPAAATTGIAGVRVRLTSVSSPGPTGADGNGEVEDGTVNLATNLSIGNLVWNDANENGLFDPEESGINNVLVELWDAGDDHAIGGSGANADTKVTSMNTHGGGLYNFSGLDTGYYFVKIPTPPLSRTSLVVDTTDNGQDGDNNGSQPGGSSTSAYSPVIHLAAGDEPGSTGSGNIDNTVDFGFAANIGSPFVCDNRFWVIQNAETSSGSGVWDSTLYYVGDGPSLVPTFVFTGHKLNGLAAYGGYLYCVDQNGNHLYRINAQGVLVDMGAIAGLPAPGGNGQWSGATALTNGRMILNLYTWSPSAATILYTIDLSSATLVGSGVTVTNTGTGTTYKGNFGDIVWDPLTGKVYGYSTVDTNWLGLFEVNPSTGVSTRVSAATPGSWGSMIIDANGLTYGFGSAGATGAQDTLYVFNRTGGVLNGSITAVGSGPAVSNSDGAACPGAPPSMKLGNQVWNDVNNNGIKDVGESGIDGVTLQLFLGGQDPLTAAPAASVTTSGGGIYSFNNLSPGQYFIYMPSPPVAYPLSSVPTATTDNGVNNDDNGIQTAKGLAVRSPLIGLAGGTEPVNDDDTDSNTDLSIDFGLLMPTADYGDKADFPAASQAASIGIHIGTNATDAEGSTPGVANATGDDTTDTDDEDLVMPQVVSGGEATLTVPVMLSGGLTLGRMGVWADWNGDGDTFDANETVVVSSSGLIDGLNTITATLSPPAGTSTGVKYLRIRVVEGTVAPAFSGESVLRGEVEDYAITVTAPTLDYGDLPDTIIGTSASNYQTRSNDNGPAHTANSKLRLGAQVDAEGNGQPNTTATGDDTNGIDDDDGVASLPVLTQNLPATLTVTATNTLGAAAFLKAWIDWNNDGNLTAGEELGPQISVPNNTSNGSFSFNFTVPGTAPVGPQLGLRIRLASATIPSSTGTVGTGEVEDYLIAVNASTSDFGDYPSFPAASRLASSAIKIGSAATDTDAANPTTGTATADDTSGTDDEDLTMPTLFVGSSSSLSIPVTLSNPVTSGKIAVWADWNGDNDVSDTGEVVALSTSSPTTGTHTITATLTAPIGTSGGVKYLRIIATEGNVAPSFSGLSSLRGEVEDYAITVNASTLDYGDLPDTAVGKGSGNYQTLLNDNGPSHIATPNTLRLGATVDTESDGQPNAAATGDGADEDSIGSMPTFYRGSAYDIPVAVFNNTGSAARVFAFIDWNNDGDFADTGETLSAVSVGTSSVMQTVHITGTTPGSTSLSSFGARFRLSSAATLGSINAASDGEVEDYMVAAACPVVSISQASLPATTQYSNYSQTLTVSGGVAPYNCTILSGSLPNGLAMSAAGAFSGTVNSSSGAYVFTVQATDANGCSATRSYTISVGSGGMSVGNLVFLDENNNGLKDNAERGIPNVPVEIWNAGADGKSNSADDQPVTAGRASALGADGMLTLGGFGSIPAGFSTLTARTDWNGAYQFTELPTGVYYLKLTPPNKSVFTSKFGSGTTTYSLNLDFPLASSSPVLVDDGTDNDSNGFQTNGAFAAAGQAAIAGVGAAVFSMPFTLATATEPGTSNQGSDEYTLDFGLRPCPSVGISALVVPTVKTGTAYSHALSASGGSAPYVYAITQGSLPSGLSMNSSGLITGTTTVVGTSAVTVRVTDALGCQGVTTMQVSVTSPMSITTSSLPNSAEGATYAATTLAATGATAPYQNWRVTNGALPDGLALDSATGMLSGTPTSPGTFNFTISVDDAPVIPATVAVNNGSVETDAWAAVPFAPRSSITGWTLGNGALAGTTTAVQVYGVNDTTVTTYGGTPAGGQYLASPFVGSWVSQTASGFTVGRPYTLRLRYAMRGAALPHPVTTEPQPPFYGNALWIAGYNDAAAAQLIGPAFKNSPAPSAANYDSWSTMDMPFVPQTSSMVFSYGLDGAAIDDVQFIPTVAGTATASKGFTVVITSNRDWGDLPDSGIGTEPGNYQTLSNDSGPFHYRNTNLRLGATLDIEPEGQPSAAANGDDLNNSDDEDAIATLPAFKRGQSYILPVSVFNNTSGSARVFAFMDWNGDGDFLDPGEAPSAVTVSSKTSQQSVNVTGTVPGNAVLGQAIGLRVRLSSATTLGGFGPAPDGEVEDYLITAACPVVLLKPDSLPGGTLGSAYSANITASGGTAPYTFDLVSGGLPPGLALDAASGVLSGIPNVAGSYDFTVRAMDANGCAGLKSYTLVMVCPELTITPSILSPGAVGSAYSQSLSATAGVAPYAAWTIISGALPAGLSLNADTGVISGTPTASNGGGSTFTVRVTDANGCQGTRAVTLKICPVIAMGPAALAATVVNSPYSQALSASGGVAPYSYTLTSGTLPAGLSLNSAGVLSGTPSSTISRTVTFTATDANGCAGSRTYTLSPSCPSIAITPVNAARAIAGVGYSQSLTATGGTAPYGAWAVTAGSLPAGLSLNATTGAISGTPTGANGAGVSVTFRVTDASGCTGTQNVVLQVCSALTLSPSALPAATINTSYSQAVTTSGGATPYTYTVSAGALPSGLSLSSAGVISGTPTNTSTSTFTLTSTDANGCSASRAYTLTPAPDSDFGDFSGFSAASSRKLASLRLGALIDVEATTIANTTASGDDDNGDDDEDGVSLPPTITQGGPASITVNVTNTSGASAFLNAWIDFDQNGSLTDAGEQIASNAIIATGTSDSSRVINFTALASAKLGGTALRVRLTSTSTPGSAGAKGNGEVEDYVTSIVAPTTDFGDFSLFDDASSTGTPELTLGTQVDLEGAATKNTSATGDDNTGSDDEDGVVFPSMTAGQPMTLPVSVTNTTGSPAYLNAWIDFNNNGSLADAGEQIATNVGVATGMSGGVVNLSFNVPANAVTAAALIGARFRLTNVITPGPTGDVGLGEVEDHSVVILAPLTDFGDFNGAPGVSNTASTNLRLGQLVDTEYAATTDALATGDDTTGSDDEDGVDFPTMIAGGPSVVPVMVTNTTGSPGYLNAWIDFNHNGVFTDPGESITTNLAVAAGVSGGTVNLSFLVPPNAVTGTNLGARVRITSDLSPGSTGAGGVGEVEDYVLKIAAPTTDFGDFALFENATSTRNNRLRLGALVDTEYAPTMNNTATGDDTTGSDDEDGVTFSAMIAGAPATLPVTVTNTRGANAYLSAWIDYNGNGDLTDPGEQIADNVVVGTGTTESMVNLDFTVSPTTLTGVSLGTRVRLSSSSSTGAAGESGFGEVEDYLVTIAAPTTDFGDFSGFAAASQGVSPGLRMGDLVDAEYAPSANASASGDDLSGSDDEDGVTLPSMTAGQTVAVPVIVTNSTGAFGYLNAWIDFNNNGSLSDTGEQIGTDIVIPSGSDHAVVNISFTVPANATTGTNLGARFRLSAPTSPGAVGANPAVGEVEDYALTIAAPTKDHGDHAALAAASSTARSDLVLGSTVDAEYAIVPNATATGDDNTGVDDEDAAVVPVGMQPGASVTIPVKVQNMTSADAWLHAWIDFNNDGVLDDAPISSGGERLESARRITSGVTGLILREYWTGISGTSVSDLTSSADYPNNPTSYDYRNNFTAPVDWADNMGQRMRGWLIPPVSGDYTFWVSGDDETQLFLSTDGDTANATMIAHVPGWTGSLVWDKYSAQKSAVITLQAGKAYYIEGLMKEGGGGDSIAAAWQIPGSGSGPVVIDGSYLVPWSASQNFSSTQQITFTVPASAVTGANRAVRFRLTDSAATTGAGDSGSGEVEDYVTTILAPTVDFGDWSGTAPASNAASSMLRLGATVDSEYSATTNADATGDDITNTDDEDGVSLPALIAGGTFTLPVVVTNTSGAAAYLNAWIDFNNNGSFADAGEQFASDVIVPDGSSDLTMNQTLAVPYSAVTGVNLGLRFRLTSDSTPGATGSAGGNGEVEDYVATITVPTTDYGDFDRFVSAASTVVNSLKLGAAVDAEYSGAANSTASGDDTLGVDDEDGVTIPTMTAGAPATFPVTVTNTSGATAYLNIWIDFNNNGSLTDAGEQVASNVSIADGTENAVRNGSFTVPASAAVGVPLGVRLRLTSVASPGPDGVDGNGEVEDDLTTIASPPLDYGDWSGAPSAASNAVAALRLGASVDTEFSVVLNTSATGDDITGGDDEDGVTLPTLIAGAPATLPVVVTNTGSAAAYVNAWFDFNNNGSFADAGEQLVADWSVAPGTVDFTQNFNIIVPANAVTGSNVGVRFRLTDVPSPGNSGTIGNGEVEDYVISIAVPATDFGDWDGAADASNLASSDLRMGALADTEYVSTRNPTADGDDNAGSDDEDGVTLTPLTPGTAGSASVVVTNNSGAAGYLNAWIDFNNNGSFADAGEQIATAVSVSAGTNGATLNLSFTVPVDAIPGSRGARFRFTNVQNPGAVGAGGLGEVEDYLIGVGCLPFAVEPAALSAVTVGTAYSQAISANGMNPPFTFSVSSGALPTGLSLDNTTGMISGTPASPAVATFTITATDVYGCVSSRAYHVEPTCPAVDISPTTLPQGTLGANYSGALSASGGTAPYAAWSVISGRLPSGLSLNATTGVISGTPTEAGAPASFTVRVTDTYGCVGERAFTLLVCPTITLGPDNLAAGSVGQAYTQTVSVAGGSAPYSFALINGNLPAGLSLDSSSGVISGVPTVAGVATFTLRVTDLYGCVGTRDYTLTSVCPVFDLGSVVLPVGYLGGAYDHTLSASGGTAPYSYVIQTGALPTGLFLATNGKISGVPSATGTFDITVRVTDANACSQSINMSMEVRSLSIGDLVFEDSNNNGIRDAGEPGMAGARVQLFAPGTDNAIGGTDDAADTQIGADIITSATGAYGFTGVAPGRYYLKVTPPVPLLVTGGTPSTADDDIDGDNNGSQPGGAGNPLLSPIITLSGDGESITDGDTDPNTNFTVDFGFWASMAVGNFIFLDINGDGVRNEGESLGNIYVEIYAEGAVPGTDSPVSAGSSGCSCKGRYYLEGLNPGNYFLHIPASQFSSGMPLEGLLPMSAVVAGDDDSGQDLIFNNSPATYGASTAVFALRAGQAPVGAAESGDEGSVDDATDNLVDLTRDLGVVAPAGTGFAASERIRRHIVTGGFTPTLLPGATTFAMWNQNSSLGDPADDPDEDGVANLLEYALGTDPANPLEARRFALAQNGAGGIAAHLTLPVATRDDIIITLETLSDLTQAGEADAWQPLSMAFDTAFNGDGTLTRSYAGLERLLAFKGLDTGFLHLKVALDADRDGVPEASATSSVYAWSRQEFTTGARTFSMPLLGESVFKGRVSSLSSDGGVVLPYIIALPPGSHYLEVLDGSRAGQRFEIDSSASSGNTVVLEENAQVDLSLVGAHIAIRRHHALAELLPPESFGSGDQVMFFDSTANDFTSMVNIGASWQGGMLSMNARPFQPHEAALVSLNGQGVALIFTGEVRMGSFATPLVAGTQLIASGWPLTTPAPVGSLQAAVTPDSADRLRLWDGDTTPGLSSYTSYYLDAGAAAPVWLPQDSAPISTPQRRAFHGFFLIRRAPLLLPESPPW